MHQQQEEEEGKGSFSHLLQLWTGGTERGKRKEQRLVFSPSLPPAAAAKKRVKVKQTPLLHFCHTFYLRATRNTLSLSFPITQKSPQGVLFIFLEARTRHFLFPPKRYRLAKEKEKRCCCLAIIFSLNRRRRFLYFFLAFLLPSHYFRTAVRMSTSRIYFFKKSPIFRRRRRRRWRSQHRKFLMDEAREKKGKRLCFVKKNFIPRDVCRLCKGQQQQMRADSVGIKRGTVRTTCYVGGRGMALLHEKESEIASNTEEATEMDSQTKREMEGGGGMAPFVAAAEKENGREVFNEAENKDEA